MSVVVEMSRHRPGDQPNFTALKLAAVDRLLLDRRATDLDFRVFWYLCSAADRETGIAHRKQQTIADAVGRTRRGVQQCLDRLEEISCIIPLTKEGGSNTLAYQLVLGKANAGSPFLNGNANARSPLTKKRRTGSAEKANGAAEKGEPSFAPTLPLIPRTIPSRARGPSAHDGLGPPGAWLRERIGHDFFHAWFGEVTIQSEAEDEIVLIAPTKYIASRIRQDYELKIIEAWQRTTLPSITRVKILYLAKSQERQ
jgi:hypothetical protein